MKLMFVPVAILSFVFQLVSPGTADEREEVMGFANAAFANSESWQKYDLLIKHTTFRNGPKREPSEPDATSIWIRFAVDWGTEEVFCFVKSEMEGDFPSVKGSSIGKMTYAHVLVNSKDLKRSTKFPGGATSVSIRKLEELFDRSEVIIPDVRLVGLTSYPDQFRTTFGFRDFASRRGTQGRTPLPDGHRLTISNLRGAIQVTQSQPGVTTTQRRDPMSLLRIQATSKGENWLISDEVVTWTDKQGIFVPTEILAERSYKVSETEFTTYYTTASIHWCSFNEPLDRKFFDPKFCDSQSQLMKSIDPLLVGAHGL